MAEKNLNDDLLAGAIKIIETWQKLEHVCFVKGHEGDYMAGARDGLKAAVIQLEDTVNAILDTKEKGYGS